MPLFDRVRELPLVVERVELEPHALPLKHMTRRTTVVHLHGGGHEGVGEDVSYDEDLQLAFTDDALPPLAGEHTLETFSELVADQPGYRPWGLEAAALDLGLRQAGISLAEAVGREPKPVRFVVSQSAVREWRELYPEIRFKLDASDKWTDEVVAELRRNRRRRRRRPEGPLRGRMGRRDRVAESSTAAWPRLSRTPGSRTRG